MGIDLIKLINAFAKPLAFAEECLEPLEANMAKALVPGKKLLLSRCQILVLCFCDREKYVTGLVGFQGSEIGGVLALVLVIHIINHHWKVVVVIVGDLYDSV